MRGNPQHRQQTPDRGRRPPALDCMIGPTKMLPMPARPLHDSTATPLPQAGHPQNLYGRAIS